jgi:hypothetical protein
MIKEIITDIDTKLSWCPCNIGCHLCSGCPEHFTSHLYDYYDYWLRHDYRNQTFEQWMNGLYEVPKATFELLEEKHALVIKFRNWIKKHNNMCSEHKGICYETEPKAGYLKIINGGEEKEVFASDMKIDDIKKLLKIMDEIEIELQQY